MTKGRKDDRADPKHSVHWGINPPLKNTTPSFLPLNLQTAQALLLGNPPYVLVFSWPPLPLKPGFFREP